MPSDDPQDQYGSHELHGSHGGQDWHFTRDAGGFLARAGEFVRARLPEHTTLLTVAERVRTGGAGAYGGAGPVFGWLERAGEVIGTCHRIADRRVSLGSLAPEDAGALADRLAGGGGSLPGVVGGQGAATAFARAWQRRTGATPVPGVRLLLYRLGTLAPPEPYPAGHGRPVEQDQEQDREQLMGWLREFAEDVGEEVTIDAATWAGTRFAGKRYTFWETPDGTPAAVAGRTPVLAGHVRLDPVYTRPHLRGRGYAAAVTFEATRTALAEGAVEVVLFTDAANPTSNALYRRLGYTLVTPVTVYDFTGPAPPAPSVPSAPP